MAAQLPAQPETRVVWTPITLEDTHPKTAERLQFTFPRKMEAFLTTTPPTGFRGSAPDGKAAWWPYFQQRHQLHGSFWVQGHMLNDNVYGPGVPGNLVPICSYLNTTMEALVEGVVKQLLGQGKALQYVVEAHWEGGGSNPQNHPRATRQAYGLIDVDDDGTLYWGEQFAPTRLSWALWLWNVDPLTGQLLSTPLVNSSDHAIITPVFEQITKTYKGSAEHYDDSQFANQFPSDKDKAKKSKKAASADSKVNTG